MGCNVSGRNASVASLQEEINKLNAAVERLTKEN